MAGTSNILVGPSGTDGPHVFVADLNRPQLDPADEHHLAKVLRLRNGDSLTISNGAGGWRLARFAQEPEPVGPIEQVALPALPITIAFALVKGQKPEWVTQKLTELGVDIIRPFTAARSIVKWDHQRAITNTERLRRVAREAAMQCRRCWLPEITELLSFAAIAKLPGLVMADRSGHPLQADGGAVAIGPEGGWAPEELALGLPRVGLANQVLRAETAAMAAACLLGASRCSLLPSTKGSDTLGG